MADEPDAGVSLTGRLRSRIDGLNLDIRALAIIGRDARVPMPVRVASRLTSAYALAGLRAVMDYVPLIGLVEEIATVLAVRLVRSLVPEALLTEARLHAEDATASWRGEMLVLLVWTLVALASVLVVAFVFFPLTASGR